MEEISWNFGRLGIEERWEDEKREYWSGNKS
jgi:hypothetical protein